MKYTYKTKGVCAIEISFELEDDKVKNINFLGGCNGNLKAISKILEGTSVDFIQQKLLGNVCGRRDTSCADQLARAVLHAYQQEKLKNN